MKPQVVVRLVVGRPPLVERYGDEEAVEAWLAERPELRELVERAETLRASANTGISGA